MARPHFHLHPHVLGDGQQHAFHITRYPGCSSLFQPNGEVINLFANIGTDAPTGNFSVVRTETVSTVRLDDLNIPPPHFMKLDIQGAELMVLGHGTNALASCVAVEIEVEFLEIYCGQPLFAEVDFFFRKQGFVLHKMLDIAGRCLRPLHGRNLDRPMSQVLWADAVFIRDFRQVGSMSATELATAAIVVADAYRSFDVATFYLQELDRRDGGSRATSYMHSLAQSGNLERLYFTHRDDQK